MNDRRSLWGKLLSSMIRLRLNVTSEVHSSEKELTCTQNLLQHSCQDMHCHADKFNLKLNFVCCCDIISISKEFDKLDFVEIDLMKILLNIKAIVKD